MSSIVTFCGIRRGVGNATVARAFAVSAVGSNNCVLLEADRDDDTSVDWAERRRRATRYDLIEVRSIRIKDYADADPLDGPEDIIVLQMVYLDDEIALALVRKSRLFALVTTPSGEDVEATERALRHMLGNRADGDGLVVVVCSPAPCDLGAGSLAAQRLSRTGVKVSNLPFLGRHAAGAVKRWVGRSQKESTRCQRRKQNA
jgi:hypothetical protein